MTDKGSGEGGGGHVKRGEKSGLHSWTGLCHLDCHLFFTRWRLKEFDFFYAASMVLPEVKKSHDPLSGGEEVAPVEICKQGHLHWICVSTASCLWHAASQDLNPQLPVHSTLQTTRLRI
jgi:hypothetical protein